MSEATELTTLEEKTRITSLHIGQVYNLGNYENMRVEVTAQIASTDDPGRVLRTLERILGDLRAETGVSSWDLKRYREILEKPESELSSLEKDNLDLYRARIAAHEAALHKREAARAALSTLEYSSEHIDHKDKWADED